MTRTRGVVVAALMLITGRTALAQTATPPPVPPGEGAQTEGEIIVTAQKRSERLIDVPIGITAITQSDADSRGVTNLSDLQAEVPGLRIVDIGPGSQRIQLRGISQFQGLPTVGNYVDEFSINPYAASGVAEFPLYDLERVEVLRGPQAVLYGEGSMGGTIRYVTANPDLERFGGTYIAEINALEGGDVGGRLQGAINIPVLRDEVGLRVSGLYQHNGGYIYGPLGRNQNGQDIESVRAKLLLKPSQRLTVSLLGEYYLDGQNVKSESAADYSTAQIVPSISRQSYGLGTALISYDLDFATFLSSTGYLFQRGRSVDDSARFYNKLFGAPLLQTAVTDSRGTIEKISQEFRLTSNGHGPIRWLLGGSYSDGITKGTDPGTGTSLMPGLPASALGVVFDDVARQESEQWNVYGQASWDITRWLTIDAGARYFHDSRSIYSVFTLIGFPIPPSIEDQRGSFDSVNPRASLTFKTGDNGTIYFSAAKGFRSGGFNQVTNPIIPPTFGPEKLWTYEAGAKQRLLGGKLYAELAVYYNDYSNIQANQLVNPTVATVVNSGSASGPGVDFSLQARPTRDLSFTGSLGYNHLRYDHTTQDRLRGEPADLVPDWNASVAADFSPAIGPDLKLLGHVDANYIDRAEIIIRSAAFTQVAPTDSRVLTNLRLGVSTKRYDVHGFINNLTGEAKIVNPAFGAYFQPIYTRPRTFGVGISGKF